MTEHILTIRNSEIIRKVEERTFKFGKARDNGNADKLINNVKLTDMPYDRSMVRDWISNAIGNIKSALPKYSRRIETEYETGHANDDDYLVSKLHFCLSSSWPECNGDPFDSDCQEYIVNSVIAEFIGLSLPREADYFAQKAMVALKNAERKLYFKIGCHETCGD